MPWTEQNLQKTALILPAKTLYNRAASLNQNASTSNAAGYLCV